MFQKAQYPNLTMGETEMCFFAYICLYAQNYISYKSSQCFASVFFFLHVHVRFSSQCELTNNWSSNKKQCSGFFVQYDKSKRPNIWVVKEKKNLLKNAIRFYNVSKSPKNKFQENYDLFQWYDIVVQELSCQLCKNGNAQCTMHMLEEST